MFQATTDHQIVPFRTDIMALFHSDTGELIATAERSDGTWTITADGVDPLTATNRPDAIAALQQQALAKLGGSGYSCLVPHGLAETP